jgi:spermidine synthase
MMGFLLFVEAPSSLGMIGLQAGSLAKFCFRLLPGATIDVAERSPAVIALRDAFHVPPDDGRLRIRQIDGPTFVQAAPQRYAVLLIDDLDGTGMPDALCTSAFADGCFALLAPGGVLVVHLRAGDAGSGRWPALARRAFPGRTLVVDEPGGKDQVLFAHKGYALTPRSERPLGCPAAIDANLWPHLRTSFARVLDALERPDC